MKKIVRKSTSFLLVIVMLMTSISLNGVFGDFEITATAAESQTTISTAQELSDIRNNLSGNYILSDNIDLASFGSWLPIGTEEEPFTGTLDGNGYVISNITIDYSVPTNIGFFGHVKNATIKNLGIEKADYNVNIGDYEEIIFSNVGGFAGVIESSTVDCCYFTGSINHTVGNYVFCRAAGIACSAPNSTITNCYVNANIYGKAPACNTMVAGCVSWLDNTTIDKCYVAGSVVAENNGYSYAGGFNASSNSSSIWGIIISYGGTVKNSVSLLSELNATGSTTYVNAIGNWVNNSNNKTISPSSADANSQTTYDSLGWDFELVWLINDGLPKLVSLPKTIDTDGDGIPDNWEINGIDVDGDGVPELDLKAMGANKNIPDIFVEIDWMVRPAKKILFWETKSSYSFKPSEKIMQTVYNTFKAHGINIHLDVGADSTDFVTGKKWGNMSGGNEIEYTKSLNVDKDMQTWNDLLDMSEIRSLVFHHCIFADCLYSDTSDTTSGITPGFGQYFAVTLGGWGSVNDTTIAGTFMHELGHSLGLHHGGCDNEHYKPNYLSIMNYAFQTTGLAGTGSLNYSDYKLPDIDEANINEFQGVDPDGITSGTNLATTIFYRTNSQITTGAISKASIDFNSNGTLEQSISLDLNPGGNVSDLPISTLRGYNDWGGINYHSGVIGSGIKIEEIPTIGISESVSLTEEKTLEESLETSTLAIDGTGCIELISSTIVKGVDNQNIYFDIINLGATDTTFSIEIQSQLLFDIYNENVTVSGSKTKVEKTRICVPVKSDLETGEYSITCSISNENCYDAYTNYSVKIYEPSQEEINEMQALIAEEEYVNEIDSDILNEIKNVINEINENPESTKDCRHICHNSNKFLQFIWKILNFFNLLFRINQHCSCGAKHW